MATQYNLTGSFTAITEESGTIQNIGYEAAELVSTTNATEGQGIELLPGEKRTFNGAMKARSKGGTNTTVNVVDFKDAAGGGGGSYVLPVATASTLGGVKSSSASGDVTVNNDGTMTVNGSGSSYTLPEASASTLGGVKIGNNISVASDGTIFLGQSDVTDALGYIPPQYDTTYSDATQSAAGLMSATDKVKLDGIESGANNYTLPVATAGALGGVKSSNATGDVTVNNDGTMTVNGGSAYTLPTASASTLGGIKVGDRLSIDGNGVLSAADQSYSLPVADASTLGGVKVGSGLSIDGNGVLSSTGTGTATTPGLTKLYTGTGNNTDGTMTQASINTALSGIGSDVSTLQTNVGTLQTNVGGLQTDMTTAQTDITNLQNALSMTYKAKGSIAFANLPATLTSSMLGWVYNIYDDFTTDSRFVEGAGSEYFAGENVAVVEKTAEYVLTEDTEAVDGKTYYSDAQGTEVSPQPTAGDDISSAGYYEYHPATYKFDVLSGYVDLSSYPRVVSFDSTTGTLTLSTL